MNLFKLIIILIYEVVSSFATSPVVDKALHAVSLSYQLHQATSVVWNDTLQIDEVTYFLRSFNGTVIISSINNSKKNVANKREKYQQTVFFATRIDDFSNFLLLLKKEIVVPIRLILVFLNPVTDEELLTATKIAMENDLSRFVIISTKDNLNVKLSTYFPFSNGICGNPAPVEIKLKNSLFPKKYSNFQRCPIRVSIFPLKLYFKITLKNDTIQSLTGLDGNIFTLLIEKLNASMSFVSWKYFSDVGTISNGTATGSFGDLVNGRADIHAPALLINYLRYPLAQISPVVETMEMYWYGPLSHNTYESERVFEPLMREITPAIIITYIFYIATTLIVKRFNRHGLHLKHNVALDTFRIFLGQSIHLKSTYWLVNYLVAIWIWFCMVVRIVCQGNLVEDLQKVLTEKPFENLKEALNSIGSYGGPAVIRGFYIDTNIYQGYTTLKAKESAQKLKRIAEGERFILATDKLQVLDLSHNLQMVTEPITHAPLCFYMRPAWPAAEHIGEVIQRLAESGFVKKTLSDITYEIIRKKRLETSRETHPLNMKTLFGCFYGLLAIYFISFFIFIVEIIYYSTKT